MSNSSEWDSVEILKANDDAYAWLLRKLQATNIQAEPDVALQLIKKTGWFAGYYHTGRFADGAIENIAFNIGLNHIAESNVSEVAGKSKGNNRTRRRVLHVTPMLAMGGHRQLLYHWICNDQASEHSLVLLEHVGPIPEKYTKAIENSGGSLEALPPDAPLTQTATMLRAIAKDKADVVIWHLIGFDVGPVVAFATPDCPPVVLIDHADHTFWLGSTVADLVVNLRSAGADLAKARRFVTNTAVLPIPLVENKKIVSRNEARQALGIPQDQVMVLTVGRGEKYRPYGAFSFVATANKILDLREQAHIYVVGESASTIAPLIPYKIHERLHFVGSIDDPSSYRAAANVYIESFPFGSQTALLESALAGLPIVSAYAPLFPLLVANDDALLELLQNPKDEQTYINQVVALIDDQEKRVQFGKMLREQLLLGHVGKGWLERLAGLYQKTDVLQHNPRLIAESPSANSEIDVNLSQWHAHSPSISSQNADKDTVLYHKAFVAKTVGDFATARLYALRCVLNNPKLWASWRLLGIAIAGRMTPKLRKLVARN